MDWTNAQSDFVRDRWRTTMSATQIAEQMTMIYDRKFNKNMIISHANRMGFPPKKVKRIIKAPIIKTYIDWSQEEIDTLSYMWPTNGVKAIKIALKELHGTNRRLIEIKTKVLKLGLKKFKKIKEKVDKKTLTPTVKFSDNEKGCRFIISGTGEDAMCCGRECVGTYCEHHQKKCTRIIRL